MLPKEYGSGSTWVSNLRYFPFVNLSSADLAGDNHPKFNLTGPFLLNLTDMSCLQIDSNTDFNNALNDDRNFLNLLTNRIRKENLPTLVKIKDV